MVVQDEAGAKRVKQELEKDTRNISDLWSEALRKYKGIVGTELVPKFSNVQDMIDFGSKEMNAFHSFRHNQKKVDKLRGLFMSNVGYIETGMQQLVAAATPAFPPAAAIGTALTYMLSACKAVSADYDVVAAFFEDMNAFLQRITILESRLPAYPAYRNCLMDVFSSVLEMCGFATKYIELGRFKKWVINMVKGEDSDLGGARKKMDTSLSRLQSATEYAILGNTEETNKMTADLQQNQDLQTQIMEEQTKMLNAIVEGQDAVRSDLKNIQKLLSMFETQRREDSASKKTSTGSASSKKPPTSSRVRSFFIQMVDPLVEYHNIKDDIVPDTCKWIFDEPEWSTWISHETNSENQTDSENHGVRVLAVQGPAGAGKSHLAVSAYDWLYKNAGKDTCVVGFFFREQRSLHLGRFKNAIYWIIIQLAEQNAELCERLNVELQREDIEYDDWTWKEYWKDLIVPMFHQTDSMHLQIVWDGLDEVLHEERDDLIQFLTNLQNVSHVKISLLCTTRPDEEIDRGLAAAGAQYITVTKAKQESDLKAIIWAHLNNDDGLKRFSKFTKQTVVSKLTEKADVMLYAEHSLRQFNKIGREPLILKELEILPKDWKELYSNMLADVQNDSPPSVLSAVRYLLGWVTFSRRAMTIDECLALLKLGGHGDFDLERELQGRSLANFLRIADVEEKAFDNESNDEDEDFELTVEKLASLDGNSGKTIPGDGDLPLRFHNRSMRDFCADALVGETSLRTFESEAQCSIFILCSKILCGDLAEVPTELTKYAGENWAFHLSWANILLPTEPGDKVAAAKALTDIQMNRNGAALRIEKAGFDYDDLSEDFEDDWFLQHMSAGAKILMQHKADFEPQVIEWAESALAAKENILATLAKAHVMNWLQAEDFTSARRSYRFARSCMGFTSFKDLIEQKDENADEGEESKDKYYGEDDEESPNNWSGSEMVAVFDAFSDIPKDGTALWALARLLYANGHHDQAREYARKAVATLPSGKMRLQALDLLAAVNLDMYDDGGDNEAALEEARNAIEKGLSAPELTPKMRRDFLVKSVDVQRSLGNVDGAADLFRQAREAHPDEPFPADSLVDEFNLYVEQQVDDDLIELVANSWNVLERLTWMTWDYQDSSIMLEQFFRAAGRAGKEETVTKVFEEVLRLLDTLNSGTPIRLRFGAFKWVIAGDIEGAKALGNEILDSTTEGDVYKFTNEEPSSVLFNVAQGMSRLIYEQYRASSDRAVKAQLLTEIKGLTHRPFALSIGGWKSDLVYHTITTARMTRKMASAAEYQDILQSAFDACYEALIDSVGWNDWRNVFNLAIIVMQLSGMEREAQILLSAQFSEMDKMEKKDRADPETKKETSNSDETKHQAVTGAEDEQDEDHGDGSDEDLEDEDDEGEDDEGEDDEGEDGEGEDGEGEDGEGGDEGEDGEGEDGEGGDEDEDDERVDEKGEDKENQHDTSSIGTAPEEAGALSGAWTYCDGICYPRKDWSYWTPDSTMYVCLTCAMSCLCETCYKQRKAWDKGEGECPTKGPYFCGVNHEHITAPVKGWGGIRNGVMTIDGEDVEWKAWLEELRNDKWMRAWEAFWLKED